MGGGQDEEKIRDLIIQKNLQEHVTLLGMKVNPYPYIAKADLFVQPSRIEAYGLTIAEALALGKPVVATDTEGARDICWGNQMCRLCEADPGKLAGMVAEIMLNQVTGSKDVGNIKTRNVESMIEVDRLLL